VRITLFKGERSLKLSRQEKARAEAGEGEGYGENLPAFL